MSWATTLETYRSEKNWQTEKEKYLNMNANQKCRNFVDWQKIPTWKEYATTKTLEPKIEAQEGYTIDNSQNKALADKVSYFAGNIIQLNVDVIVNAANKSLLGGGGVDGAIHKAAGMNLLNECRILMGCLPGLAEITGGYKLPAKYIIHTVGPQDKNAYVLQSCYKTSLKLMLENNLQTIAFPCISTGAYGYPNESAAHIAIYTVRQHLQEHADKIDRIIFCLFTDIDKKIYEGLLQTYFPLD